MTGEVNVSVRAQVDPAARDLFPSNVLADYYRLRPGDAAPLTFHISGSRQGYFSLGDDTICYGTLPSAKLSEFPSGLLWDATKEIRLEPTEVRLPFDPCEVIRNLRRERYSNHFRQQGSALRNIAHSGYYRIRPMLGISVRRQLQKLRLRGWRRISFPQWPIDTTVDRLHRKLLALSLRARGVERLPFIWFWPDGHPACAIMTHDVETAAGCRMSAHVMDLDESQAIRSSFEIVPKKRYTVSRSFLEGIKNRGFEVNVHDLKHDGRLFIRRSEFLRRATQINQFAREFGAKGFRSGALYRNADWYDAFDFSYDMSLPNVAHLDPQRGGCCTVMPYFIGNIVELPLTCTQDYSLHYILGNYSLDLWEKQIALIRKNSGLISLIVHPDYLRSKRAEDCYQALLRLLVRLRDVENVWMPLPGEVASWWRQRSQLCLRYDAGAWKIEGPGRERARVAYATLDGDSVTYALE